MRNRYTRAMSNSLSAHFNWGELVGGSTYGSPSNARRPKTDRDEQLQVDIMRTKGAPQIGAPSPIGPMVVPWRRTKNIPISGMFRVVSCRVVLLRVVFCMFRGTRVVCSRVACRGVFACAACPSCMLRVLQCPACCLFRAALRVESGLSPSCRALDVLYFCRVVQRCMLGRVA